ncbi:hypothetical protein B5M42_013165 [Paenibacillus athensensis]|uniref:Glycosyl hydrolase n=1 Tax=Paenibacillus athensensis TaxID=1967502 RepID=A0A4Y8Q6B0_9BACL|nr:glycosyl hydrolase family 8 [Paenibacillus athensensis]MCD1259785.1 hypothetical protein [Paenibacillus athensensis]
MLLRNTVIAVLLLAAIGAAIAGLAERKPTEAEPADVARAGDSPLYTFVRTHFLAGDGGVYTNLRDDLPLQPHVANNHQMLSESTGLLLLYSLRTDRQALFDQQAGFVRERLDAGSGRIRWVIDPQGRIDEVTANATVDDLRIVRALREGADHWQEQADGKLAAAIARQLEASVRDGEYLSDFYNWDNGANADTLTASYLDLYTLRMLGEASPLWQQVYARSRQLLQGAALSSGLFEKQFSLTTKQWMQADKLNAIDSLYTALHLAEVQGETTTTLAFLRKTWNEHGKLFNDYTRDGQPASELESPAAYALAYRLIKLAAPGDGLADSLYARMTQLAVLDPASPYYGGYVDPAKQEGYSFDQLQGLLAEAEKAGP